MISPDSTASGDPFPIATTDAFLERMMGDASICLEIVTIGLQEARENAKLVEDFRAEANLEKTRQAVHSLRGSAAIFGADTFTELLKQMETDCEEGNAEAVRAAMDQFSAWQARYEDALAKIADEMRSRL